MKRLRIQTAAALSVMFDIDIPQIYTPAVSDAEIDAIVCPKCHGCGDYMHYLTRKTLRCERCGGIGLRPS